MRELEGQKGPQSWEVGLLVVIYLANSTQATMKKIYDFIYNYLQY